MIRISQINIPIFEKDQEGTLRKRAAQILKCPEDGFRKLKIVKKSIDARDRNDIRFSYTADVKLRDTFTGPNKDTEKQYIDRLKKKNVSQTEFIPVLIPEASEKKKRLRPVIVGAGPCGLFAALTFLTAGIRPVIVERGEKAEDRKKKTELFFRTGKLFTDSNIQFGEGGAGLFSDGKLNTSIKGRDNYVRFVLETFAEFGAPEEILTEAKPHVGTDILEKVLVNIREYILEKGGEYYFNTVFRDFDVKDGKVCRAYFGGALRELETDRILLCQGHSARDTYELLLRKGVPLEKKPFAMGIRIQHPQALIDAAMYGAENLEQKEQLLGPSPYKLVHSCENGRSVFSFCMCPGGYVINSSSEEEKLCINGMSYSDRGSGNANSALVVGLNTDDFPGDALAGIRFQQQLEQKAYNLCHGLIPYESFSEFEQGIASPSAEEIFEPAFLGLSSPGDVAGILPDYMKEAIVEGVHAFGRQIRGFDDSRAVIAGVEARTSSPVRIPRNADFETGIRGIYAAGEGAGYAGGITSAAVDGIRAALSVISEPEKDSDSSESAV